MVAASLVGVLLIKLNSMLNEEAKLLGGVRHEMHKLALELDSTRAFLRDAEATQGGDERFQTWVKQVIDVSYEIEDLLDEFLLRLRNPRGDGNQPVGFLRTWVHSLANLSLRHRIGNQIQELRGLINQIEVLRARYDHNNRVEQGRTSTTQTMAPNTFYDPRLAALFVDESEIVGFDWRKECLAGWVLQDSPKLITISLHGMAGVGKTTLAKLVYDKVKAGFQNSAWINVSKSSTIKALLRSMVKEFFRGRKDRVPEGIDNMENSDLINILREYLQQAKYFVVLDDIWESDVLEGLKLGLPDNKCGSRILFTTRNRRIASTHSTDSSDFRHPSRFVFCNDPLSDQDAWTLFCKKAFQGEREEGIWSRSCPPDLEELSRKILQRCEGLPLAIGAVGGLLSRKEKTLVEWERVHRSLEENEPEMGKVKMMLSLSYDTLPYHLKSCFLYLGIFPEQCLIGRRRVIRLWIAEGVVQEKVGKSPEEVADDYLGEIMACSLMQVAEYYDHGAVRSYRLHDFMRQVILSKSRQERFGTFSTRELARSSSSTSTNNHPFNKIRRLSIQNDFQSTLPGRNERFSHLRSLFSFGIGNSTAAGAGIFPGSLSRFRLLKVLDMEDAPIERFPSEIGSLFHLRYLSLKGTKISSVSKSLGKLQNLQTLNLKETRVSELPVEINKLEKLRDLLVYRYVDQPFQYVTGFKALSGKTIMGKLRSLRTLAFLELDDQGASFIEDLATLTQLRRLAVTKLKNPDGPGLCASIEKMTRLDSLSIQSASDEEFLDLSSLQSPPPLLQRLYLKGRLDKLPNWIPSLRNLVKVALRFSRLHLDSSHDLLAPLRSLPYLVALELSEAYEGSELRFESGAFPRLGTLRLYGLRRMSLLVFERGATPYLRRLFVVDCVELRMVPIGIEHLPRLRELHFVGLPHIFFSKRLKMMDKERVRHIPVMTFNK